MAVKGAAIVLTCADVRNRFLAKSQAQRGAVFHVNCQDKANVYKSFLVALFGAAPAKPSHAQLFRS